MYLKEGDVIELEIGHKVYATLPKHCFYGNCFGDMEPVKSDVKIGSVLNGFDTSFIAGKYVVVRTAMEGGSHGGRDDYPDGHHVTCERIIENGSIYDTRMKVDFYQSGCFTAMIEPDKIKPLGKATLTYKIES